VGLFSDLFEFFVDDISTFKILYRLPPISDSRKGCPYEPCTIFNCSKSYEKSVPPLVGSVWRAVFDIIKKSDTACTK